MATDIVMPRLSDSMEEGTILRWIKSQGDDVAVGDELVEIETDKANMVYEADAAGTLIEILAGEGDTLPIDLAANAASLGAASERVRTIAELKAALVEAKRADGPYVVTIETDRYENVPAYESWWDVAPAQSSGLSEVRAARERYEKGRRAARTHLRPPR